MLALALVVALLQSLLPPLQSPDEFAHLVRAYSLLTGDFFMRKPANQSYAGVMVDVGLIDYFRAYERIPYNPDNRVSGALAAEAESIRWQSRPHFSMAPGAAYNMPLIYLPQGAALAIGKRLDLSVHHSYTLARWLTLCTSLLLLLLAFRWCPPTAPLLALLFLPMSLFQWASPTIDGLSLALAVWCAALFLHLMAQPQRGSIGKLLALSFGLLLLATCRIHLLPMIVLLGLLALQWRWWQAWLAMAVVLTLSLGWTLTVVGASYVARGTTAIGTGGAILHYLQHPGDFWGALGRTLSDADQLAFYWRSFIGILGWLDTPLPGWAYGWIGGLFLATVSLALPGVRRVLSMSEARTARLCLVGLGMFAIMLVFIALLLTWNPLAPSVIEGVQGRYFIIPFALLTFACENQVANSRESRWRRLQYVCLIALIGLSLVVSLHTLLGRYYLAPLPIMPKPSVFTIL